MQLRSENSDEVITSPIFMPGNIHCSLGAIRYGMKRNGQKKPSQDHFQWQTRLYTFSPSNTVQHPTSRIDNTITSPSPCCRHSSSSSPGVLVTPLQTLPRSESGDWRTTSNTRDTLARRRIVSDYWSSGSGHVSQTGWSRARPHLLAIYSADPSYSNIYSASPPHRRLSIFFGKVRLSKSVLEF